MTSKRLKIPGAAPETERAIGDLVARLEARLEKLEARPGRAGVLAADTVARVGEFLTFAARSDLMPTCVLPEPTQANRNGRITVSFRNANPVRLVCIGGTVNGATEVINTTAGTVECICDGDTGWATDGSLSSTGSATDAQYLLRAAHGSLPNARVADDSTEIDLDYSGAGLISWFLKTASVGLSKLANLTGLSVLGRAANSTGVMAAITAGTARHVLRANSGLTSLEWGYPVRVLVNADEGDPAFADFYSFTFSDGLGTETRTLNNGSGEVEVFIDWDGVTPLVPDGDYGHIVVSSSGTVWLWDSTVAVTGDQAITTTGDFRVASSSGMNFRTGSTTPLAADDGDLLVNATGGLMFRAGTGTVGTLTGQSDGFIGFVCSEDFQVAATSGFNLRAGSATTIGADAGDGVLQATGGIGIRAGTGTLGTITGAADGDVDIDASSDILGDAAASIVWTAGTFIGLRAPYVGLGDGDVTGFAAGHIRYRDAGAATFQIYAHNAFDIGTNVGDLNLRPAGDTYTQCDSLRIEGRGSADANIELVNDGVIRLDERTSAPTNGAAFGAFWLLNLAANAPRFTDDANVTWNLLRRVNVQVFTADGTYTPTTGMAYCIVISTGGGGGSGGADCDGSTSRAAGGAGGGAGATCIELFTAAQIGASQTVTVGVGGTAGSATGGNGGNGEDTTFGALHTAGGGTGGEGEAADATYEVAVAGLGGTATGGLLNIPGGDGEDGFGFAISTLTHAEAGAGGASFWGGGGRKQVIGVAATTGAGTRSGIAGTAYGSGASGAALVNTTTGTTGAAGKDGVCVVIEFI